MNINYVFIFTQHPELHELEWWIANCCFVRNRNTPDNCKSTNNLARYCVNRNRYFSHCQSLPRDLTITDHTLAHMLGALYSDPIFEYHPNPEFLVTIHRAHTKIADSLMQLMANNQKHPCTHHKHVLNI